MQTGLNGYFTRSIARVSDHLQQRDALNFEVLNNVVVELTRLSIENRNLKMRVESLNTRLDFAERRGRALEGVVQYKQGASPVSLTTLEPVADATLAPEDADKAGRRRRRRRGRRRGAGGEGGEAGATPCERMAPTTPSGRRRWAAGRRRHAISRRPVTAAPTPRSREARGRRPAVRRRHQRRRRTACPLHRGAARAASTRSRC